MGGIHQYNDENEAKSTVSNEVLEHELQKLMHLGIELLKIRKNQPKRHYPVLEVVYTETIRPFKELLIKHYGEEKGKLVFEHTESLMISSMSVGFWLGHTACANGFNPSECRCGLETP